MKTVAEANLGEQHFSADPNGDRRVVFRLLSKFDLSAGDVAEIFAAYLATHPAGEKDLERLRAALRSGATENQARIIAAAGGLLTSEQVAELLGYGSRQTSNNKKRSGELIAVSLPNRRGDFFPRCQFDGSHVKPWVRELLKRIPDSWSALGFVTAKYEDLNGLSWLDVVREDPSRVEDLLGAADEYVS